MRYDTEDDIFALATPRSESALAIVRCSGKGSIGKAARLFSRPGELEASKGGRVLYGEIRAPEEMAGAAAGSLIDEATLIAHKAPKSYTGEDSVEFIVHGSLPVVARLESALRAVGFRDAERGEFTLRSFLHGKRDLSQAEAVHELVGARTLVAGDMALARLSGSLRDRIAGIKASLVGMLAEMEAGLDYAEGEDAPDFTLDHAGLGKIIDSLRELSASYKTSRLYAEGVRIAIAGRTNAGKSSLFNLFLKEERAIVSEHHGTTRDYLEAWIDLGGVPCLLYDTAGIRESSDPVEAEGIKRARAVVAEADLVLYAVDGAAGLGADDEAFLRENGWLQTIRLWNKIDAPRALPAPEGWIPVSALTGEGFAELERRIAESLGSGIRADAKAPGLGTERQRLAVDRAVEALDSLVLSELDGMPQDILATDLREAVDALGEITGEVTTDEILDQVFSRFCLGK
jgi:tRNA modification GTPase